MHIDLTSHNSSNQGGAVLLEAFDGSPPAGGARKPRSSTLFRPYLDAVELARIGAKNLVNGRGW